MSMNNLQVAALALVRRYVERQKIVLAAMQDVGQHLLMRSYQGERNSEFHEEYKRVLEKFLSTHHHGSGYWGENNEWKYSLHGGGCRLVNTITGEPINWDAPKVERFDKFWFMDYLIWMSDYEATNLDITVLKAALPQYGNDWRQLTFFLLEQLHQNSKLSPMNSQNKYILLQQAE